MKKAPKRSIRLLDNRQLSATVGGQGVIHESSDQGIIGSARLDQGTLPMGRDDTGVIVL